MNLADTITAAMAPPSVEQLAAMSDEELSEQYFHEIECGADWEDEIPNPTIAEVEKRGLSTLDMRNILNCAIDAEEQAGKAEPYSDEELRNLTDEQLADWYFDQKDVDPHSREFELINSEVERRGKAPGDLLIGR